MTRYFFYLGIVWAMLAFFCFVSNFKLRRRGTPGRYLFFVSILLGLGLGFLSMFCMWQYDVNTRLAGFPFAAAAFRRDNELSPYLDYVGPLTGMFLAANALCWGLFLQIPLYFAARFRLLGGKAESEG